MIGTKLKDLDRNIRLLNEEGYTVKLHYKQGKYYIEKMKGRREMTKVGPAKRGRYIEAMSGVMHVYPNGQVMCSVCKQRMPLTWKKMPPYCFGCGAKMDGEPNEREIGK